jgi:E3 ubiquitin-protein ligase UBR7
MIGLSEKDGGPKATTMVDCSKKDTKNGDGKHSSDTKGKSVVTEVEVDVVTVDDSATRTNVSSTRSTVTAVSTTATTTTIESSTTTVSVSLELSQDSEQLQTSNQGKRSLETTEDTAAAAAEERGESGPSQSKKLKLETVPCKLKDQPSDAYPDQEMNLFATEGWRDLLCQCDDCTTLYTTENVSFILGEEPIFEDEEDDDAETSILESGMKKLNEMDRVKMMDGMLAYNKMRDEIRTFLAPFSEQGKVVTAEDIQAFFTVSIGVHHRGFHKWSKTHEGSDVSPMLVFDLSITFPLIGKDGAACRGQAKLFLTKVAIDEERNTMAK